MSNFEERDNDPLAEVVKDGRYYGLNNDPEYTRRFIRQPVNVDQNDTKLLEGLLQAMIDNDALFLADMESLPTPTTIDEAKAWIAYALQCAERRATFNVSNPMLST